VRKITGKQGGKRGTRGTSIWIDGGVRLGKALRMDNPGWELWRRQRIELKKKKTRSGGYVNPVKKLGKCSERKRSHGPNIDTAG